MGMGIDDLDPATRALVKRWLPRGWTLRQLVRLEDSGAAIVGPAGRFIETPPLITLEAINIFLHEVGHARLGHFDLNLPRHVEEYEAERFALSTMQAEHIPVPTNTRRRAKGYVRWVCAVDRLEGLTIKPHIARWCGSRATDGYDKSGVLLYPPRSGVQLEMQLDTAA